MYSPRSIRKEYGKIVVEDVKEKRDERNSMRRNGLTWYVEYKGRQRKGTLRQR